MNRWLNSLIWDSHETSFSEISMRLSMRSRLGKLKIIWKIEIFLIWLTRYDKWSILLCGKRNK
jgi:hypothetical protein